MPNKIKIPGMFYILLSFTPWILYWILSAGGNRLGVLVPLLVSLFFVIPQIRRKDYNLFDLTSALYFSVAVAGLYVLNLEIFLESSGFLGYAALFLMAAVSLVIKQPYTLQVARRDYPESYWTDRSFLTVNNIVTAVWAGVFLINAFIFFLPGLPSPALPSLILTAFGIVFSIVFPLQAPALFAAGEFKRYDWKAGVSDKQPQGETEYHVIIAGAGIGGLTCAALLAKRGLRVLVLEAHYQVGGYCSSFQRKGFVFNTGVEDVSGLWEGGPVSRLLNELGLEKEDLFVRNTTKIRYKGEEFDLSGGLPELVGLLGQRFPKEKENIAAFFAEAQKAYEEGYKEAGIYGVPLPSELIVKVFGKKKLLEYPKKHPHFHGWLDKTYKQMLDMYFEDEDLKAQLCALLGYVGTAPEKTPAAGALTACVSYYIHGGWFPKGGAQKFANSLKGFIETHGGTVLTGHKVEKIRVEKGRVKGLETCGVFYTAPVIVANINAKTALLELVGEKNLGGKFAAYIKGIKMSPSCFMVFLGVDMDLSSFPTLIKNLDEGLEIVINSNADPTLAPERKASLTLLADASWEEFPGRGTKEYAHKKRQFTEALIHKAEKTIPGLRNHIVFQEAATPGTLSRYTAMPEGALYSFSQEAGVKRPCFKTPIKGLYLAGASTFPGGGIEAVVISGIICANDIANWEIS